MSTRVYIPLVRYLTLYGMSLKRNYARLSHLRIPAQQTCGWARSPGVLTDPYARQRGRETESFRQKGNIRN